MRYYSESKKQYVELDRMHTNHLRHALARTMERAGDPKLIEAMSAELSRRDAESEGPAVENDDNERHF